ncbi:MAG: methyltransferase domain-containing protein [Gemmatimonadaceae bacterium]
MSTCCCDGLKGQFDRATADRELARYRKKGPPRTTQLLIDCLRDAGVAGCTLIDIGGGIGAIHHELLDLGASRATHVDVSADYLRAAETEASRRNHTERVQFMLGDFVELAYSLPAADIVTLDRVVCCYPDMEMLIASAAGRARRVIGLVYPRDVWWVQVAVSIVNGWKRLQRSSFRVFVHAPDAIDARLRTLGFERRRMQRTLAWEVAVYITAT